ncbi:altronate oxidoreductase [compost metagenome]
MKMKIRILPVLLNYYKLFQKVPSHIAFGFAAFLLFMRSDKKEGNQYFGNYDGHTYAITDDEAAYFYDASQQNKSDYVNLVLADNRLWGTDLAALAGFNEAVKDNYNNILKYGMADALARLDQTLHLSK